MWVIVADVFIAYASLFSQKTEALDDDSKAEGEKGKLNLPDPCLTISQTQYMPNPHAPTTNKTRKKSRGR